MAVPTRFKGKEAEYKSLLINAGIFELWHDREFDDYTNSEIAHKVIDRIVYPEGLLIHGPNGTGKTMLLNLAMKLLVDDGKAVFVIDFRNLVKEYTMSWRGGGMIERLMTVDCLGIDDIGKEFNNSEVSKELAITALDYVMRYRFQRMKPTWITTNMALAEIKSSYNPHIASLFKRCMAALKVEGKDYGDSQFKQL